MPLSFACSQGTPKVNSVSRKVTSFNMDRIMEQNTLPPIYGICQRHHFGLFACSRVRLWGKACGASMHDPRPNWEACFGGSTTETLSVVSKGSNCVYIQQKRIVSNTKKSWTNKSTVCGLKTLG